MPRCDLVLEGGGVKGIALVGAIEVLEEAGYTFGRIAGTSAGAIVGSLVATGAPVSDLVDVIRTTNWRKFRDWGNLQGGMYEGEYFHEWMKARLAERGVHTFADLAIDAPELPKSQRYRLVVTASDVTVQGLRRLPWDLPAMGRNPDSFPVADANRASMSIPIYFEPWRIRDPRDNRDFVLVDGGWMSNFPVGLFDRPRGQRPRWPTFGIKLSSKPDPLPEKQPIRNSAELAWRMARMLVGAADAYYVSDPDIQARTIFIDTGDVSSVDFDLPPATVEALYQAGRTAAAHFLTEWNFERYVAAHRSPAALAAKAAREASRAERPTPLRGVTLDSTAAAGPTPSLPPVRGAARPQQGQGAHKSGPATPRQP